MGAIEDVRKVIQDLVAPELKSLHEQIKGAGEASKFRDEASKMRDDALSAKIDNKFDILSERLESLSDKTDAKFALVMAEMKANQASLIYSMNMEKRIEAIERKGSAEMQAS